MAASHHVVIQPRQPADDGRRRHHRADGERRNSLSATHSPGDAIGPASPTQTGSDLHHVRDTGSRMECRVQWGSQTVTCIETAPDHGDVTPLASARPCGASPSSLLWLVSQTHRNTSRAARLVWFKTCARRTVTKQYFGVRVKRALPLRRSQSSSRCGGDPNGRVCCVTGRAARPHSRRVLTASRIFRARSPGPAQAWLS